MSQRDGQRVVVLHQGGVLVVQHQLLQRPVQVVGLREAEARGRAVDDAVLRIAVHPAGPSHRLVQKGSHPRRLSQLRPRLLSGDPAWGPYFPISRCRLPTWPWPCRLLL